MSETEAASERALILASFGRDATIVGNILRDAGIGSLICPDLDQLCRELAAGAAVAVVAEEALNGRDLGPLAQWIAVQPAWSDFPFVLLTHRGGGVERNPAAVRLSGVLGNVGFLERPFHPATLVSAVRIALRGRLRQYEARERIAEIQRAEVMLERRVEERTAELAAANKQLASQMVERERMEAALHQSQRLEAVGQFTSGVAHDFNNLLMVVLGSVRHFLKDAREPGQIRRLEMMQEAAERGARLTAQLLAFSRRQKLDPRPVDLNETVAGMRDLLQSTIGGSVRIETDLDPELSLAMIDPTQFELAILNLAINGRDAMEVGGTLRVATANVTLDQPIHPGDPPAGDYVMLSVADTGTGMPPEVLARAFEPFFTTKPVGKGSGLGLSQVFGLAKQSGGGVRIDTRLGEGTSVQVYLPRTTKVAERDTKVAGGPASCLEKDCVVLLVDDDDAVREVTAAILDDLGYKVIEAASGGAALERLAGGSAVDVVVLDFAMPGMNGAEVEREIRARRPQLPVLFATGYADFDLLEAGEDRIVRKPFRSEELASKLTLALRGRRSALV